MAPSLAGCRLSALVVFSCLCTAVSALTVEHSFGGQWLPAGHLEGLGSSAPLFVRNDLTAADKQQLKQAAASNGLYTLKLNLAGSGQYVVTSVRAACLLQATEEQLRVHVDQEGRVLGASYEVVPTECTGSTGQAAQVDQLAAEVPVKLEAPRPGPIVTFTGGEDLAGAQRGKKAPTARPAPQAQGQQPGQEGAEAGAQGAGGKGKTIPKEEQTWWQRNWVYLAVLFGLGLQVLKAQLEPQMQEMQRQQDAGRRAGGGGGLAAPAAGAAGGAGRGQPIRRRG